LIFNKYHIVYFIGVGGIGMSALARWFISNGKRVYGYDKTPSAITQKLETEGIEISFEDSVEAIPEMVKANKEHALVIYTPAIPKAHKGINYLREEGFTILKRAEVLGLITKSHQTIAVAGTHGKTSTSGMIAHALFHAGVNVTGFLGGIIRNYDSNFIQNRKNSPDSLMVVEADEFDRSFLQLEPNIAIITSADADHLDIYGDREQLVQAYRDFGMKVREDGFLILNSAIVSSLKEDTLYPASIITYGIEKGTYQAKKVRIERHRFVFDLLGPDLSIEGISLQMPGFHNIENAVAAIISMHLRGVSAEKIKKGIESYKGVKRRFETVYSGPDTIYIDDYAHHPAEIEAFIKSVRAMYKGKRITAIFQPHLFTRTRDFAIGFSNSLSLADEVILLPIYPAREEPLPGVKSEMLLDDINADDVRLVEKDDLIDELSSRRLEVLLTIGAGDIDRLVDPIAKHLKSRTYAD